ncbi:TVP38/TMEM64 family protein [Peptoniphilus duerdenii]|uniref:TVP38/TMEM64 family protein n=1 Tax=Peptoniphilus duerdenii TaxID=507750 RepID=UPI00280402B5|nr:TVP38/TMEM64 family protein [Peptoniphilus duerdenii]
MKKENRNRIILLIIIGIFFAVYFFVPSVNREVNESIRVLTKVDINGVAEYIRGFGVYAVVVSFLLMLLQSLISPIPAFFITLSNAMIWGWAKGALLSWSSAMVGAAMCFFIARILGRDVVRKFASEGVLVAIEEFFKKYGKYAITVARLLPFIPFDAVSYAAGLTSMDFWGFFLATGIGQLPATIVYSYAGGSLTGGAQALMVGLLILFAASIIIYVARKIYNDKQTERNKIK